MNNGRTLWDSLKLPRPRRSGSRPHMVYLAIGFPPAAKSCAYRMRETANQFAAAGWDVTAVTIADEAWEREYGLDHTLSQGVEPSVRVVKLPLFRDDLETDIRTFTEQRALAHKDYLADLRKQNLKVFPEPVFGGWRPALEKALLRIHRERHVDLLVTTCAPYVNLSATWKLWETHRVPYVVDFRDGWSVDVINNGEAFTRESVSGQWEIKLLTNAVAIWNVNEPISRWYRERYPELAHKMRVVRNGYDAASIPAQVRPAPPDRPLTFGYLGALNLPVPLLSAVLEGWRTARTEDPALADARFEVRGHIGAAWARGDNAHAELLRAAAVDGVLVGGSVPKAEVVDLYSRWDAVVLMVTGGRYMTSGKVYEYMATGLPVVSAHEADHDASTVLSTYPLWTGAVGLDPAELTGAFRRAAAMARTADAAEREKARAEARQYAREEQLIPAVREVTELVLGAGGPAGTPQPSPAGARVLAREGRS
ncbi:glycosyl transferase [Micromonospora sp. WMMB482]|uniref:glycosyltransferase n=2 Tax=unclassified Micromonospora TaxID=2617518 RepID=UPI001C238310|nr:glycosyltransferase [Micromonospora sp. WMMB482]MBU8859894.1 glycosyl transferase [Micromonospora sp. WMMB482]